MKITQRNVELIYKAANGILFMDEMIEAADEMTTRERKEFFKLMRMLSIIHGCNELLETPENTMPI